MKNMYKTGNLASKDDDNVNHNYDQHSYKEYYGRKDSIRR